MSLPSWIRQFLQLGLGPEHDKTTKIRVMMINLDLLLGLLIVMIAIVLSFTPALDDPTFQVNSLVAFVSIGLLIGLMAKGQINFIAYGATFLAFLVIGIQYLVIGAKSEVHFFFLGVCLTPMLYFFGRPKPIAILTLICFATFIGTVAWEFEGFSGTTPESLKTLQTFSLLTGTIVLAYKVIILLYLYHEAWTQISQEKARFEGLFTHNSIALNEVDFKPLLEGYNKMAAEGRLPELMQKVTEDPAYFQEVLGNIRLVRINQALLDLTGAADKPFFKEHAFDLINPSIKQIFQVCILSFIAGNRSFHGDFDLIDFQNRKKRVRLTANLRAFPNPYRALFAFQDITEQYTLEQELRTKSAFFESLLKTIPNPIFYKDTTGAYLGYNHAFSEAFGVDNGDLIGKTVGHLASPENRVFYEARDEEILRTGEDQVFDTQVAFTDKTDRTVRFNRRVFRDSEGEIAGIVGSMIDITDQALQTFHLNVSNARLQAVLEASEEGILVVDQNRQLIHFNHKFLEIWNISYEKMQGLDSSQLIEYSESQLKDQEGFREKIEQVYAFSETIYDKLYFKDGRIYERCSFPYSRGETEIGRVWTFRDITQSVKNQEALQLSELQYRDILDNAYQAIFVVDLERMLPVTCNARTLEIFGCPDKETFFSLSPKHFNAPVQADGTLLEEFLQEKMGQLYDPNLKRLQYDALGRRLDGTIFPKRVNVVRTSHADRPSLLFFVTDYTEKQAAEQNMRLHNQIINSWVSSFATLYYRFNSEGVFTEVMGSSLEKLGLKSEDLIGLSFFDTMAHRPDVIEKHQRAIDGEFVSFEFDMPGPDGTVFFDKILFFDQLTDTGIGLGFEITDRKRAEAALRESELRFRTLFEQSPFGIAIRDMEQNKLVDVNPRMSQMMGYTHTELTQESREVFTAWEDQDVLENGLKNLLKGSSNVFAVEKKYQRKDQSSFWARIYRSLVEIEGQTFLIGFIEDIDARRKAEAALRKSEARYRLLFEHAFEGIMVFDARSRRALDCNQKMLQYFGIPDKQTMLTTPFLDFSPLTQPDGKPSREMLEAYIQQGLDTGTVEYEWLHKRKNGSQMHTYVYALRYQSDQDDMYLVLFQDITAKKKQERIIREQMMRLSEKTEELERYIDSNMQLENFAYIASHDLRAPLRAITNFTHLLEKRASNKLDSTELEYLHFMSQAAENMYGLIESLLTYSKVDGSKVNFQALQTSKLLELINQDVLAEMEETGAEIKIQGMPGILYGDISQLRQLFQNLLTNALKFSSADRKPLIQITCVERPEGGYLFSVSDNGIGIESIFYERIFLLFKKLHSQDEYAGTGIGLALCKRVVTHHGGQIWVESTPGTGTTFYFTLPHGIPQKEVNALSTASKS